MLVAFTLSLGESPSFTKHKRRNSNSWLTEEMDALRLREGISCYGLQLKEREMEEDVSLLSDYMTCTVAQHHFQLVFSLEH